MGPFEARSHGRGSMVPLGVVEVHDGFHCILADLESFLISSVRRCLRVHGQLLSIEQRVNDTAVEPVVHSEDSRPERVSMRSRRTILGGRCGYGGEDHLYLAADVGMNDHRNDLSDHTSVALHHADLPGGLDRCC